MFNYSFPCLFYMRVKLRVITLKEEYSEGFPEQGEEDGWA